MSEAPTFWKAICDIDVPVLRAFRVERVRTAGSIAMRLCEYIHTGLE